MLNLNISDRKSTIPGIWSWRRVRIFQRGVSIRYVSSQVWVIGTTPLHIQCRHSVYSVAWMWMKISYIISFDSFHFFTFFRYCFTALARWRRNFLQWRLSSYWRPFPAILFNWDPISYFNFWFDTIFLRILDLIVQFVFFAKSIIKIQMKTKNELTIAIRWAP